jgi:hypothetical protein
LSGTGRRGTLAIVRTYDDRTRRAARPPHRGAVAAPHPADVVGLQRTVGNAAVAGLLQRNEESAALLEKLAVPKLGEGPSIEVQKKLVLAIEDLLGTDAATEINLGGILLDRIPDCYEGSDDLFAKVSGAKLLPLPSTIPGESFRSAGADRADMVIKAGLGPAVVENTLRTMIDALQFEYLRLAGLPNAQWKILVEVHYIRARPKDMTGFHKDTKGETLFVNLNYNVGDNKLMGPEFVINPDPSPEHEKQIKGTGEKPRTLPSAFTDDLDVIRKKLPEPTEMKTGVVNPYGYVAFVDEAIHHATPYYGHRFVTGKELRQYLTQTSPEYVEITRAAEAYRKSWWPSSKWPFESYVKKSIIAEDEIGTWQTWLAMTGPDKDNATYTREELGDMMSARDIDLMIETVGSYEGAARKGAGGFYGASIPGSKGFYPVNRPGRPPLVRQASTKVFKAVRPKPLPDDVPRRFIRTWVRVVPETKAAKLRDWATKNSWL